MNYTIGQIVAPAPTRQLWRDTNPRWHVMVTTPQRELAAAAWLARNGVAEAWYPKREVVKIIKHGRRRTVTRFVPEWPRYIFALCPGQVWSWSDLFHQANRKIIGVVTVNSEPAIIDEPSLLEMMEVPNTLRSIREAKAEASRIRAGDRVKILTGEMAGWQVTVEDIDPSFATFLLPLLGGARTKIEIGCLRKVAA